MKFSVFQVSRKGGREKNEDRMGYSYTRDSCLFLLADGMGGHPEGEVAAQIALQSLSGSFQKAARPQVADVAQFLAEALLLAHEEILSYAHLNGMVDTPRTTLVAAMVQDGCITWIHCGDSRLYLIRGGAVLMRTRDHSYLEQHSADHLRLHLVNRNMLFTCLGSPARPIFDISQTLPLQHGDKVVLCSDGLWDNLSEDQLVSQMSNRTVFDAVPELVEAALHHGGAHCDNVTLLAFEWEMLNQPHALRGVSTDGISEGGFASTIQSGGSDGVIEELDEATIERSIAEINEAIRRSTLKNP